MEIEVQPQIYTLFDDIAIVSRQSKGIERLKEYGIDPRQAARLRTEYEEALGDVREALESGHPPPPDFIARVQAAEGEVQKLAEKFAGHEKSSFISLHGLANLSRYAAQRPYQDLDPVVLNHELQRLTSLSPQARFVQQPGFRFQRSPGREGRFENISVEDFIKLLPAGNTLVIDIRSTEEMAKQGHLSLKLKGEDVILNVPLLEKQDTRNGNREFYMEAFAETLAQALAERSRANGGRPENIVFLCRIGNRTSKIRGTVEALVRRQDLRQFNFYNLEAGIYGLFSQGPALVRKGQQAPNVQIAFHPRREYLKDHPSLVVTGLYAALVAAREPNAQSVRRLFEAARNYLEWKGEAVSDAEVFTRLAQRYSDFVGDVGRLQGAAQVKLPPEAVYLQLVERAQAVSKEAGFFQSKPVDSAPSRPDLPVRHQVDPAVAGALEAWVKKPSNQTLEDLKKATHDRPVAAYRASPELPAALAAWRGEGTAAGLEENFHRLLDQLVLGLLLPPASIADALAGYSDPGILQGLVPEIDLNNEALKLAAQNHSEHILGTRQDTEKKAREAEEKAKKDKR